MDAVWAVVALLPAGSLAITLTTRPQQVAVGGAVEASRQLLPPPARRPGVALGLASDGYGTIAGLILLRLAHGHLEGRSLALCLFATAFLVTRAAGSSLVDRFGGAAVGIISTLVEAIGLLVIAGSTATATVLFGVALVGCGVALLYPAMVALTVERTADVQHGAAVGALTSCWDLAVAVAAPLGGLIAGSDGYPVAFAVAGAVVGGAAALLLLGRDRSTQARPSPSETDRRLARRYTTADHRW